MNNCRVPARVRAGEEPVRRTARLTPHSLVSPPTLSQDVLQWAEEFTFTRVIDPELFPWSLLLPPDDLERLRKDLLHVLNEPEQTGEPADWDEIIDILDENAEMAGWDGPTIASRNSGETGTESASGCLYTLDIPPQQLRLVERAPAGVRHAAEQVITEFLAVAPTHPGLLTGYRIKKLPERDVYQIELPDAYRLRYIVDEEASVVYVVYLGPHPTGAADGRERAVRAVINRRRNERIRSAAE